jgi:hypothetical protein
MDASFMAEIELESQAKGSTQPVESSKPEVQQKEDSKEKEKEQLTPAQALLAKLKKEMQEKEMKEKEAKEKEKKEIISQVSLVHKDSIGDPMATLYCDTVEKLVLLQYWLISSLGKSCQGFNFYNEFTT